MPSRCGSTPKSCRISRPAPARSRSITRPAAWACGWIRRFMTATASRPITIQLIGKLIVHGRDRPEALARLNRALGELIVDGVDTTVPLFHALLAEPDIQIGRLHDPLAGKMAGSAVRLIAVAARVARAATDFAKGFAEVLRGILPVTRRSAARNAAARLCAGHLSDGRSARRSPQVHWVDPRRAGHLSVGRLPHFAQPGPPDPALELHYSNEYGF